ncbi:hypothetical protein HDV57DRAFT_500406 [Trichoderma longibrachiatum]|uniref:Uncharacterized protein n=1 Tax=Trichoderma longibrachiatum ATCC 18648 TaxID=983965 RepID=A0A2T4BS08_TRILO|nr:hypothetical protein M440DRAFT_167119 [Trichoderma longibrachiatum ATCC 18648]
MYSLLYSYTDADTGPILSLKIQPLQWFVLFSFFSLFFSSLKFHRSMPYMCKSTGRLTATPLAHDPQIPGFGWPGQGGHESIDENADR